jgi:hypothetical protein
MIAEATEASVALSYSPYDNLGGVCLGARARREAVCCGVKETLAVTRSGVSVLEDHEGRGEGLSDRL